MGERHLVPKHYQRGRALTLIARLFGGGSSAPNEIVPPVFLKFKSSEKTVHPCHSERSEESRSAQGGSELKLELGSWKKESKRDSSPPSE